MDQPDGNNTDQIADKLITYLRAAYQDVTLAYDLPLTPLKGGIETATYHFQLKGGQSELNRPLVLRLYPEHRDSEDAVWESSVQHLLAAKGYPAANIYTVCTDRAVLGGAFFIMEFLPGQPLSTAPFNIIPDVMGKTHADLHNIDPQPLVRSLNEQGFGQTRYQFRTDVFNGLAQAAEGTELPWIGAILDWLVQNRPPEPAQLAICHGDFHPQNILVRDGKVTGVLDWHIAIADPVLDVANTIRLIMMIKHFAIPGTEAIDWALFLLNYLEAYRTHRPLDLTHMDYYRVVQNLVFLYDMDHTPALRIPSLISETVEFIQQVTGIQITGPR